MGKTTLVYEWSLNKPHLYFFATHLPSEVLLRESFQKIAAATQMTLAAAQHYLNDLHTIGVVGASPIANPSA
ncbi:MAG: hypothetical protein KKD28_05455 [Chloroflexi bacterium]|nr:hypothetical protein [Chloroflexota bacterium]MBU1660902.1 hypothetical protein [Chloroflexota bacterium]